MNSNVLLKANSNITGRYDINTVGNTGFASHRVKLQQVRCKLTVLYSETRTNAKSEDVGCKRIMTRQDRKEPLNRKEKSKPF